LLFTEIELKEGGRKGWWDPIENEVRRYNYLEISAGQWWLLAGFWGF